jgi:hypothetical protein
MLDHHRFQLIQIDITGVLQNLTRFIERVTCLKSSICSDKRPKSDVLYIMSPIHPKVGDLILGNFKVTNSVDLFTIALLCTSSEASTKLKTVEFPCTPNINETASSSQETLEARDAKDVMKTFEISVRDLEISWVKKFMGKARLEYVSSLESKYGKACVQILVAFLESEGELLEKKNGSSVTARNASGSDDGSIKPDRGLALTVQSITEHDTATVCDPSLAEVVSPIDVMSDEDENVVVGTSTTKAVRKSQAAASEIIPSSDKEIVQSVIDRATAILTEISLKDLAVHLTLRSDLIAGGKFEK